MKLTILSAGPHSPAALGVLTGTTASAGTSFVDTTCITATAHDLGVAGLRLCPDLDAAIEALCGASDQATTVVRSELATWGLPGLVPGLTDHAIAAALARNIAAAAGLTSAQAAARQLENSANPQSAGSAPGALTVLPASETPVELHVIEPDGEGRRGRHVQRWLADPERRDPEGFALAGLETATCTPGVLEAIRTSDVVVLLPMSPVLDAAGLLGLSGVRDALRGTTATVVAMSPVGLATLRDQAAEDAAWAQAGLTRTSAQVARLYADFVDRLLIDDAEAPASYPTSMTVHRVPLSAALAGDTAAAGTVRATVLDPAS